MPSKSPLYGLSKVLSKLSRRRRASKVLEVEPTHNYVEDQTTKEEPDCNPSVAESTSEVAEVEPPVEVEESVPVPYDSEAPVHSTDEVFCLVEGTDIVASLRNLQKSSAFVAEFQLPTEEAPSNAPSSTSTIRIDQFQRVTADEFRAFLKVLERGPHISDECELSEIELLSALKLAHQWKFDDVFNQAVELLETRNLPAVRRLQLGELYNIRHWIINAIHNLALREECISSDEARSMGFNTMLFIFSLRDLRAVNTARDAQDTSCDCFLSEHALYATETICERILEHFTNEMSTGPSEESALRAIQGEKARYAGERQALLEQRVRDAAGKVDRQILDDERAANGSERDALYARILELESERNEVVAQNVMETRSLSAQCEDIATRKNAEIHDLRVELEKAVARAGAVEEFDTKLSSNAERVVNDMQLRLSGLEAALRSQLTASLKAQVSSEVPLVIKISFLESERKQLDVENRKLVEEIRQKNEQHAAEVWALEAKLNEALERAAGAEREERARRSEIRAMTKKQNELLLERDGLDQRFGEFTASYEKKMQQWKESDANWEKSMDAVKREMDQKRNKECSRYEARIGKLEEEVVEWRRAAEKNKFWVCPRCSNYGGILRGR